MDSKHYLKTIVLGAALVASCAPLPKEGYYTRGQPESLVSKSSEVVDFKIESPASVEKVSNWIARDKPTRAILKCPAADGVCGEVQSVLHQYGVPVKYISLPQNSLALVYERVQARNCENRYIDDNRNPYNLNQPTYGCTVSANIVQMVANKHVFTDPTLMGPSDATKAVQAMSNYNTPSKLDTDFQAEATQQSLSVGSGVSSR